jgi:hypothetical protein
MANRAMGMAMVKPNCPTKASDPQTEGGCFFFMSSLLPLALVIPVLLTLTVMTSYLSLLYQWDYSTRNRRCATGDTKPGLRAEIAFLDENGYAFEYGQF